MEKPFSQACENNKLPILTILSRVFIDTRAVLEIGSGTGQHAVFFAENLPHLTWYPTDCDNNVAGIALWLKDAALTNIASLQTLDVNQKEWPKTKFDGAFSANTAHIMALEEVEYMFQGLAAVLASNSKFCLYGPFKYQGNFTTPSNERFDQWLKLQADHMGVRDIEYIESLADANGFVLAEDNAMPANNQLLVFLKR